MIALGVILLTLIIVGDTEHLMVIKMKQTVLLEYMCECDSCGYQMKPHEVFMVNDKLWNSIVWHFRITLHLHCFEKQLGRQVISSEFTNAPINYDNGWIR